MDEKSRIYDEISRVLTDYEEYVNTTGYDDEIYERAADMYSVLVDIQSKWETVITAQ